MTNSITMTWSNPTPTDLYFTFDTPEHGNDPTASPTKMAANTGLSNVVAQQSHNGSPGPQGEYYWQDSSKATIVTANYHHPSGTGQTNVQVQCSPNYQVSDSGKSGTYVNQATYTDSSLQNENATISLYLLYQAPATNG